MTVCPKCGYERTEKDNNFISSDECPKCGIVYNKWTPLPDSKSTESALKNDKIFITKKEKKTVQYKPLISFSIIIILVVIFAKFTFFNRKEPPRLVSTLPVNLPVRTGGMSWIIRTSGDEGTITAAGQLFKPPLQTPVLFKLGFLFTQFRFTKKVPDFKLQVILSEWYGDRPNQTTLWVSEQRTIPSTTDDYQADWIDFDVPHLSLKPKKLYIAWITLSGLENPPDASVCISYSNETGDTSPYPGGMYTLYKQANPNGDVSQMINSAWDVYEIGRNLNFRMSFENSKKENDKKDLKNDDSQDRLNELIQKKTESAIIERIQKEEQKRQETKRQELEKQEERKQQQFEMTQRQEERRVQDFEREKQNQEERKRQLIERELQQYEQEKRQNEINQKQSSQQNESDSSKIMPRPFYRIPPRR